MSAVAFQATGVSIVYSTVYSSIDQRKHQSSTSLTGEFPQKRPVTRKKFSFEDVIMMQTRTCVHIGSLKMYYDTWEYLLVGSRHVPSKVLFVWRQAITWTKANLLSTNRPLSQIPECACSISHNAPFRTEICTFLFWMEPCGVWNRCILGFVNLGWYPVTINYDGF